MMRALYNTSGQLDCFIPEFFSGCVTPPEAGGVLRKNLSGLADHGSESFGDAARESLQIAPLSSLGCAKPAGGSYPPLPAGDLSDARGDA